MIFRVFEIFVILYHLIFFITECGHFMRWCTYILNNEEGKCVSQWTSVEGYQCEDDITLNKTLVSGQGKKCKYHKR